MITVHVEYVRAGDIRRVSIINVTNYIDVSIAELAPEIVERMALLRLAPIHEVIEGIGMHLLNDEFYLYFPDDFDLTRLRPTDASPRGDA